jgi:hypothetical protein
MRPRKTTFVINDSTSGGLKSLTIKTINVRKKGFAGDVSTLARVNPPKVGYIVFQNRETLIQDFGCWHVFYSEPLAHPCSTLP